jgi:hypothetical protein
MRFLLFAALPLLLPVVARAQAPTAGKSTPASLTVEKIMRDPAQWVGASPSNIYWGEDGKRIYFNWNPEKARRDSLYSIAPSGGQARKISLKEQRTLPASRGQYDQRHTRKVYEKDGDIYLLDLKTQKSRRVTNTAERETEPDFALLGRVVSYTRNGNLFTWDPATGETTQRTDFRRGPRPAGTDLSPAEKFLKAEQMALFEVLRQRDQDVKAREKQQKALAQLRPKAIYLGTKTVENLQLSPDGRYVTYSLLTPADKQKVAIVPSFVTASGFTEDISTRTKVGATQTAYEMGL